MKNSSDDWIIRRLVWDDLPELKIFYQTYHPDRPRLLNMDLWHWEFVDNPNRDLSTYPFYIIEYKGKIKGGIGAIPFSVQIGKNVVPACHPVNYFIAPEFKGLPALRLLRTVLSEYSIVLSSYVSNDSAKLLKATRFIDLSKYLHDYFMFFRVKTTNSTNIMQRLKSTIILLIRSAWTTAAHLYYRVSTSSSFQCHISHKLSENCIPAADSQTKNNVISIVKNSEYLHWRYGNSPVLNCVYVSISENGSSTHLAVMHLEKSQRKAVILDIVGEQTKLKQLSLLLLEIILYCRKNSIEILTTTFLNEKLASLFLRFGFGRTVSGYRFMVYTKNRELENHLSDSNKWNFVIGDTDVY
jgi:hypothetical protein